MTGWGDHRHWPDVPEKHLEAVQVEAGWQLTSMLQHAVDHLPAIGVTVPLPEEARENARRQAHRMVEVATSTDGTVPDSSSAAARESIVQWVRGGSDLWPDERWWWTPLGLVCSAWHEDGRWAHLSNGKVPQWLPAATIARNARVSGRTIRRWGENRKRVRQRGSVDDGKRHLYHRGDVAKLVVMRYVNLG